MDDDPLTGYESALPSGDQMSGHEPLLGGEKSLVQALLASDQAEIVPSELFAAQLSKELPQLQAMLRRGDARQRSIALRLIGVLAANHPPSRAHTIPILIEVLTSGEKFLRLGAARGLIRIRRREDIPRLIALTHHDDPDVRRLALWIVRRRLKTALSNVITAMADPDPRVRQGAVVTIAAYHDPSLIPILPAALSDPRAEVRCKAINALSTFQRSELVFLFESYDTGSGCLCSKHTERTLRHLR